MRTKAALALMLMAAAPACHAQQPAPPLTNGQATKAMRTLMGMDQIQAVLGTCKPAAHPDFKGQTACTLLAVSSGGTSETQADFHWNGKEWVAAPSDSQGVLPFPDPVLMNIHAGAKIDQNAGPIH